MHGDRNTVALQQKWKRILRAHNLGMDRGASKFLVYGCCYFDFENGPHFFYDLSQKINVRTEEVRAEHRDASRRYRARNPDYNRQVKARYNARVRALKILDRKSSHAS